MASETADLNFTLIKFTVSRKTGRLNKNFPGMEMQQRRVTQANSVSVGSDHGRGGPGQALVIYANLRAGVSLFWEHLHQAILAQCFKHLKNICRIQAH